MRSPTAQRILESARKLFNDRGTMHVRLQHIADETRISVGNLAYHFRNKEAIVQALYAYIHDSQQHVLSLLRQVPLFVQVNELLARHWGVQLAYRFFYLDTLDILRLYPAIRSTHQEYLGWQHSQLKLMVQFNLSRGALILPSAATPDLLARHLARHLDHFLSSQVIGGHAHPTFDDFATEFWHLMVPWMSAAGLEEYLSLSHMNAPPPPPSEPDFS
ncbi:MAG: TetR/AcrR family transcriptional regulator [Bacteroidetes bacterium]|nr:MAG: TetR/AcrR family transcriptional regulator [Bacteroidota bacterium]